MISFLLVRQVLQTVQTHPFRVAKLKAATFSMSAISNSEFSLVSQRDQWIDLRRPARGDEASQQRHND